MEIDKIYYKAKDGRIFTDPLKCESYEKTIGILPGSVGELINKLEEHDKGEYVCAIVWINEKDKRSVHVFHTSCLDLWLGSYVNVNDIDEEQRYMKSTVGGVVEVLKSIDKDYMCQYMIVLSEDLEMKNVGVLANYNKSVWKE